MLELLFPQFFIVALVYGALGLCAVGLLVLIFLLIRDLLHKRLW